MFGLTVNSFINVIDHDEYWVYRDKTSTMDINNISQPHMGFIPILGAPMHVLEMDGNKAIPPLHVQIVHP